MTKREKLVNASYEQVNRGIYVWGAKGQNVSAMRESARVDWITRRESSMKDVSAATITENIRRDLDLYEKRVKAGINPILAFDCSGFAYWCQVKAGLSPKRVNAASLYASYCTPIDPAEIKSADLVFRYDEKAGKITHAGIYVGDDKVNECRGRDEGVVTTAFKKRLGSYWNRFGRLKKLKAEYDDPEPVPAPEPVPEPVPVDRAYVRVKGGSVYVRTVDHVPTDKKANSESILGVAHRGDKLPYVGTSLSTGWYNVFYKGKNAWISCRPDLTEVIDHA